MAHPLNVQACLDWYRAHMPGQVVHVEHLLTRADAIDPLSNRDRTTAEMIVAMMLQGFEAGRAFQRDHPDVESGVGYLPRDVVPQLSPSTNCPNCDTPITVTDCKSIPHQRYQCGQCRYVWDVVTP